jgi:hemoglobin/transferrin/lactoferrin receptor protein
MEALMATSYPATWLVAMTAFATSAAFAQTAAPPEGTTVLSPIVVDVPKTAPGPRAPGKRAVGTNATAPQPPISAFDALSTSGEKSTASVYDSAGTVTVKSTAEMERQNINTPRDFVRDEPGIAYGNQPTRGGGTNYVIRGIGENRVRVEIDGVKVPDFPGTNAGSPTGYSRDFVDLDALKRVEIIRGPASALYGSDALGGVVSYVTKDPADYLKLVGKDWYMSTKGGFDTVDRSVFTTITGATRVGNVESMALVTRRWGHDVTPNGSLQANPQSYITTNTMGKIVYNALGGNQLKLTGEYLNRQTDTFVRSEIGSFPSTFMRVFNSTADDTNQRARVSLEYLGSVDWWLADSVKTNVYATQGERQELSNLLRANSAAATTPNRLRLSEFQYSQTIVGGEAQFTASRFAFGAKNLLTYGVSLDHTSTTRPRYRTEQNLVTGVVTSANIGGESYPNKNFPDTETTMAAAYVQNTAQWGAFRLTPAVRFDLYDLKVKPDDMFNRSNLTGVVVSDLTATAISPKLGATYDLNQNYRVFGQYARGFRAPPYDNANFGFRNTTSFYEILPSFGLKPETVDGFEGGLRAKYANGSSFQFTGFYNKYQDFIDIVTLRTAAPPALTQFQYQNVSNVTIYGWEAKGEWKVMPTWSLFGSMAYAIGTNEDTRAPIDSVDPFKVVGGVRYRGTDGWSGEVRTTWVAEKDRVSAPGVFVVPAHTTVDTLISYETAPFMTVNVGVFNIFDQSYFNPVDVAGVSSSNTLLELYRAPGRSLAANVTFRW